MNSFLACKHAELHVWLSAVLKHNASNASRYPNECKPEECEILNALLDL